MDNRPKVIVLSAWQYYLYGWWYYPLTDKIRYLKGPPK